MQLENKIFQVSITIANKMICERKIKGPIENSLKVSIENLSNT